MCGGAKDTAHLLAATRRRCSALGSVLAGARQEVAIHATAPSPPKFLGDEIALIEASAREPGRRQRDRNHHCSHGGRGRQLGHHRREFDRKSGAPAVFQRCDKHRGGSVVGHCRPGPGDASAALCATGRVNREGMPAALTHGVKERSQVTPAGRAAGTTRETTRRAGRRHDRPQRSEKQRVEIHSPSITSDVPTICATVSRSTGRSATSPARTTRPVAILGGVDVPVRRNATMCRPQADPPLPLIARIAAPSVARPLPRRLPRATAHMVAGGLPPRSLSH